MLGHKYVEVQLGLFGKIPTKLDLKLQRHKSHRDEAALRGCLFVISAELQSC